MESDWAALHRACFQGDPKVVKLLLAHPAVDVNVQTLDELPPILLACYNCKCPRVDVTLADHDGHTLLWLVSYFGYLDVAESLMASGKTLKSLSGSWPAEETSGT